MGLLFGGGEGMSWPDPDDPHWRFALQAAVEEINAAGVEFTIVKGDWLFLDAARRNFVRQWQA